VVVVVGGAAVEVAVVVAAAEAADDYDNCDRYNRKGDVYDGFDFITENEECDLKTKVSTVQES
jgi:hypothetical protein